MPDDRSMSDGDGQLTVERGANGGLQITDPRGQSVWAKITGQDAGTNRYAWAQVNDADATFPDGEPSAGFALSGTEDVEGWPAYEITGATDVATDGSAIVRLWPSPAGSFWIFTNSSGGGGSGSAVYAGRYETTGPLAVEKNAAGTDGATYANPVIPAGATLPDNAPVFFFEIPTDAGKYWVIPSGPASSVYPGYVTIGIQAFLGQKTFVNSVTSGDALYVLGGGSGLMAGGGTGSGTYPLAVPTSEGSALAAATTATPPDSTRDYLRLVGGTGTQTSYIATSPVPSAGSGADLWLIPGAASGAAGRSVSMGRFGYYNATDTKVYTGVSGSTMVGVDVQGGIVVGGTSLADPNADRIVFWDDSAGALAYATPSGLEFSATTFRLVNQGAVADTSDVSDTATQLNALLAKLRTAGVIS